MVSNREIRRLFNLYAELLLLHEQDERLAALLSGAAYRMRRVSAEVVRFSTRKVNARPRKSGAKAWMIWSRLITDLWYETANS